MTQLRRRVAKLERIGPDYDEEAIRLMTDAELEAAIIRGMSELPDNGRERPGNRLSEDKLREIAAGQ